jgi:hypothetical protein
MRKPINIIICGGQDRGKSAKVKQLLKKQKLRPLPYDVNGEYTGIPDSEGMDVFLENAKEEKNRAVIFEEATIFFSNKGRSEEIISMLVKHNGNVQVFCFHSLRAVPTYIIELCHYFILFKTKDNPTTIYQKYSDYPEIISLYEEVKRSTLGTCTCKHKDGKPKDHGPGFHFSKTINIEP